MSAQTKTEARVPGFVPLINSIVGRMLGSGLPVGPNALLTVRGRKSGLERTLPIAVVEVGGRRWVQGAWGETEWVRNLRVAGRATVTVGRRSEAVLAAELSCDEATAFFADVLGPYVRSIPFGQFMIRRILGSKDILDDPRAAGERHPVFELLRPA